MARAFALRGLTVALALAVSAGTAAAQDQPPPAAAQEQPAKDFSAWLDGLKAEAGTAGIGAATLEAAFAGVAPIPRVIELDRKQPESRLTFEQYMERVVTPARIERGRRLYAEHRTLLEAVGAKYGVQPRFLVALWGVETDFGRVTGGFPVVASLATLAFDGRRSAFFRKELLDALRILDQGHIGAAAMTGSWAGAMGQCQFMPSSFMKFAQDWNGDGRRDIWSTQGDVFASAANYLATVGWDPGLTWGRAVRLPASFDPALVSLDVKKPLEDWAKLGVRSGDGGTLPQAAVSGSLVAAQPGGPYFLVYDNFRTILHWNRSTYFALSVGHLADRIGGR